MLIRSQDKKSLYNLQANKGLWISKRAKEAVIVAEGLGDIGRYLNEERAIKVLDMIEESYIKRSPVFQMPEDGDFLINEAECKFLFGEVNHEET